MAKGKKTGGRVPGSQNEKQRTAQEICAKLGFDPFETLCLFAKGDWEALGYSSSTKIVSYSDSGAPIYADVISAELRSSCAKDASKYVRPQLKALEHAIDPDKNSITVKIVDYTSAAKVKDAK